MNIDITQFPFRERMNDRMVAQVRYTGPALYVAGGDPVNAPTELGMAEVYAAYGNISNGTAVILVQFRYTTQKLQMFVPNTGAEFAGDASAYTGTLTFFGKG